MSKPIAQFTTNERYAAEIATKLLNEQTRKLHRDGHEFMHQIDTLRDQNARLQAELDTARERVRELEDVVKEAYRIATDTGYETPQLCLDYVKAELREANQD